MKVKYFLDTNTAHVEFKDNIVHETKEISENIYIDIDAKGNLVGMTPTRICGNFPFKKCLSKLRN